MLIGNHPELKHWRPRGGVACPAPFPSTSELTRSIVKEINCIAPSGLKFTLEYEHGQCRVVKQFRDMDFARALLRQRDKCIGVRFSLLQFVDIEYPTGQFIWLDHMMER